MLLIAKRRLSTGIHLADLDAAHTMVSFTVGTLLDDRNAMGYDRTIAVEATPYIFEKLNKRKTMLNSSLS